MTDLSDRDWDLINAYHDRELSDEDARDLEARLASEPALARALKDVGGISASLSALRPEVTAETSADRSPAANRNWRPMTWLAGGAIVAAITLAIVLKPEGSAEPTAFDIHADLAHQTFSTSGDAVRPVAAARLDGVPDLASANLTPVSFQTLQAGEVTHYTGRNGCRLSYFRGQFPVDGRSNTANRQVETWTTSDNMQHGIIATGMDQSKFDAIAAYLKLATRQKSTQSMLAAVTDATRTAGPCVG